MASNKSHRMIFSDVSGINMKLKVSHPAFNLVTSIRFLVLLLPSYLTVNNSTMTQIRDDESFVLNGKM